VILAAQTSAGTILTFDDRLAARARQIAVDLQRPASTA
jgi:hypothetical protein